LPFARTRAIVHVVQLLPNKIIASAILSNRKTISILHATYYYFFRCLSIALNCKQNFLFILSLQPFYYFVSHKSFAVTYDGVDALFGINKTDECVHMIGHDHIAIDRVSIIFEEINL
jgi:hypothetical protein